VSGRRGLGAAAAAAIVATAGDLLMLFVANAERPELALPRPPAFALALGGALGVAAIPIYALGYAAVARAIEPGSRARARLVRVGGLGAAAIGATIHGLTALAIHASPAPATAGASPVAAVAASGPLVALWAGAALCVLVASASIAASRELPRRLAWCNPSAATALIALAGAPAELGRSFLVPAAPNLAHVAFFGVALAALGRRARRR